MKENKHNVKLSNQEDLIYTRYTYVHLIIFYEIARWGQKMFKVCFCVTRENDNVLSMPGKLPVSLALKGKVTLLKRLYYTYKSLETSKQTKGPLNVTKLKFLDK